MTETGDPRSRQFWSFLADADAVANREKISFSGLSLVHQFHNYLVCGDPGKHFLRYFGEKYIGESAPDIASLGCGNGHLERVLATDPNASVNYNSIDGYELNPELVKYATDEAAKLDLDRVRYHELDLNHPVLGSARYDIAIFFHSLHHVAELETCLDAVDAALKDDGLLLLVDFVGATRFQWPEKQRFYVELLLALIADDLKVDLRHSGEEPKLKLAPDYPTAEQVAEADPSEAVRSGEIMEVLRSRFRVIEQKPMCGTLLSLVLEGIAGNFDESDPHIQSLILSLAHFEETLINEGVLSTDYVFAVLGKQSAGRAGP